MKNNLSAASQMDFNQLIVNIEQAHADLSAQACRAVNISLTLRNWLIGFYIHEYELSGSDRAKYGEKLIEKLSGSLKNKNIPRTQKRELNRYLLFYKTYPQIGETLSPQLFNLPDHLLSVPHPAKKETPSPQLITPTTLISQLSFSHFVLLIALPDNTQRAFYEVECIHGH